jgi:hypothetical protein
MTTLLDDSLIAAIQLRPRTPNAWIVSAEAPKEALAVKMYIELMRWRDLKSISDGLLKRSSGGGEAHSFIYLPHEDYLELPVSEPCVLVDAFTEFVYLSVRAFDALMLRFMRAAIEVAIKEKNDVLKEPWWPDVLAAADALEQRARERAYGAP